MREEDKKRADELRNIKRNNESIHLKDLWPDLKCSEIPWDNDSAI